MDNVAQNNCRIMSKSNEVQVKVIGAGWGRTGTSSFQKALEILGFGPCYHMKEIFKHGNHHHWLEFSKNPSNTELLHSMLGGNGYVATCDFPSSPYWKEQLALYPDAKVILTARDQEKWYQSCINTIFLMNSTNPAAPLGVKLANLFSVVPVAFRDMLINILFKRSFREDWSKENVIQCYNEYCQDVIKTCPPEKLLVFEVSEGWEPLCKFLEVPVPKEPFPHVNDTQEFQSHVRTVSTMGYAALTLFTLSLIGVGMLGHKLMLGSYIPSCLWKHLSTAGAYATLPTDLAKDL